MRRAPVTLNQAPDGSVTLDPADEPTWTQYVTDFDTAVSTVQQNLAQLQALGAQVSANAPQLQSQYTQLVADGQSWLSKLQGIQAQRDKVAGWMAGLYDTLVVAPATAVATAAASAVQWVTGTGGSVVPSGNIVMPDATLIAVGDIPGGLSWDSSGSVALFTYNGVQYAIAPNPTGGPAYDTDGNYHAQVWSGSLSGLGGAGLGVIPLVIVGIGLVAFAAVVYGALAWAKQHDDFVQRFSQIQTIAQAAIAKGAAPKDAYNQAVSTVNAAVGTPGQGFLSTLGTEALWVIGGLAFFLFVLPRLIGSARRSADT